MVHLRSGERSCRRGGGRRCARPEQDWAKIVADAKKEGKLLADDTRAVGGGYLWYFVTYDLLGDDFHKKVAANSPILTRDQRESQRRVARGEYAVYFPFILTDTQSLKGLPVKAIMASEGAPYVLYGNIVLKSPPHPNSAKLYIDFLQSCEAQEIYAREGHGVVLDGVTETLPPDTRRMSEVKLLGTADPDRQNQMLDIAKRIYK
ncbi:MAG TPA: substrate-binding domain-containing protein [Xanthobacteraceae bacterium]